MVVQCIAAGGGMCFFLLPLSFASIVCLKASRTTVVQTEVVFEPE